MFKIPLENVCIFSVDPALAGLRTLRARHKAHPSDLLALSRLDAEPLSLHDAGADASRGHPRMLT